MWRIGFVQKPGSGGFGKDDDCCVRGLGGWVRARGDAGGMTAGEDAQVAECEEVEEFVMARGLGVTRTTITGARDGGAI